jgi:ADP-ribosylglycohydrolase
MTCAINHLLPAVYYLSSRFHNDFESAILHVVNGGGLNQARAILTGALIGAQVGFSQIPRRFVTGLDDYEALCTLANKLATRVENLP